MGLIVKELCLDDLDMWFFSVFCKNVCIGDIFGVLEEYFWIYSEGLWFYFLVFCYFEWDFLDCKKLSWVIIFGYFSGIGFWVFVCKF